MSPRASKPPRRPVRRANHANETRRQTSSGSTRGVASDVTPRNYHITLANGSERNQRAADFVVAADGSLILGNAKREPVLAYAAGQWLMIETEQRDDRGSGDTADDTIRDDDEL